MEIRNQSGVQDSSRTSFEDELVEIDKLFHAVMLNRWEDVVSIFKDSPRARKAKLISKSEDTALHIAVSNGQTEHAKKLVDTIDRDVLEQIRNAKGNTPLHLAAMLGNRVICEKMVLKSPQLMSARNEDGETPIFMAARHGQAGVFFYLHEKLGKEEEYLQRSNEDTILHVAISSAYFGMAMKIIDYHPTLVDAMNVDGLTPLHVLANKPNAFKTSTRLGTLDSLIYYSLHVDVGIRDGVYHDKIKIEKYRKNIGADDNDIGDYPKNYEMCMSSVDLFKKLCLGLIANVVPAIVRTWIACQWNKLRKSCCNLGHQEFEQRKIGNPNDEENPQQRNSSKQRGYGSTGGASLMTIGSDQRQDDAQDVPNSSTSSEPDTVKENIENTTGQKEQSTLRSCFSQYCVEESLIDQEDRKRLHPANYDTFVLFLKLLIKVVLGILGVGIWRINEIRREKRIHIDAKLLMEKLVDNSNFYEYYRSIPDRYGRREQTRDEDHKAQEDPNLKPLKESEKIEKSKRSQKGKAQTPILIAAKNGVTEMVEKILEKFPVAIQDEDAEQKNVVLVAVENRQPHVYKFLLKRNIPSSIFRHVTVKVTALCTWPPDNARSIALCLSLAVSCKCNGASNGFSFPPDFFPESNNGNQTPNEVFVYTHEDLIKDGSEWLTKTSEACSVVAALVATVAFATSTAIPGGINEENGTPTLEGEPAFNAFAISSLVALCFSITAIIFCLSILTSRYQVKDFAMDLPRKLLLGLTSLFASIVSMLASFCAGHNFVLNHKFRYVAYPLYAYFCLPIAFFYFDLILSIFKRVPQRSYEVLAHHV